MSQRSYLSSLICTLALCVSSLSSAQSESPPAESANSIAAEALFSQGNALLDSGFFEEACKKFEASQKLDPGVGTLLHLADCYEKAGRFASAWRTFDEAAELAAESDDPERQQVAEVRAAALSPRAPKLSLTAASGVIPEGYQIRLDGAPINLEQWSNEQALDAGPHTVSVSAPEYLTSTQEILLVNDSEPVVLRLNALKRQPPAAAKSPRRVKAPIPPPTTTQVQDTSSPARSWGYLFTTAGVLSLGAGGVFSFLALNKKSKADDDCTGNICQTPEAVDQRAEAKRLADLATIFTLAGAVTSVGGVGLIIASPSGAAPSPQSGLSITAQGTF